MSTMHEKHTYGFAFLQRRCVWYVDGKAVMRADAPDSIRTWRDWQLKLNVAMGGNVCKGAIPQGMSLNDLKPHQWNTQRGHIHTYIHTLTHTLSLLCRRRVYHGNFPSQILRITARRLGRIPKGSQQLFSKVWKALLKTTTTTFKMGSEMRFRLNCSSTFYELR